MASADLSVSVDDLDAAFGCAVRRTRAEGTDMDILRRGEDLAVCAAHESPDSEADGWQIIGGASFNGVCKGPHGRKLAVVVVRDYLDRGWA